MNERRLCGAPWYEELSMVGIAMERTSGKECVMSVFVWREAGRGCGGGIQDQSMRLHCLAMDRKNEVPKLEFLAGAVRCDRKLLAQCLPDLTHLSGSITSPSLISDRQPGPSSTGVKGVSPAYPRTIIHGIIY